LFDYFGLGSCAGHKDAGSKSVTQRGRVGAHKMAAILTFAHLSSPQQALKQQNSVFVSSFFLSLLIPKSLVLDLIQTKKPNKQYPN
jgi:hypothetical protein